MKLYETAPTPSSRRVSIFLKLIGSDVERVQLDVRGGDKPNRGISEKES